MNFHIFRWIFGATGILEYISHGRRTHKISAAESSFTGCATKPPRSHFLPAAKILRVRARGKTIIEPRIDQYFCSIPKLLPIWSVFLLFLLFFPFLASKNGYLLLFPITLSHKGLLSLIFTWRFPQQYILYRNLPVDIDIHIFHPGVGCLRRGVIIPEGDARHREGFGKLDGDRR